MTTCPKCQYVRQPSDTAASYECPKCGIVYEKYAEFLKKKVAEAEEENKEESVNISFQITPRRLIGIAGSFILMVSVFLPIISVPIMGNISYFQNGRGDGAIVFGLAALSLVFILIKKYKFLWITALGSLGIIGFDFFALQSRIASSQAEVEAKIQGNPFGGLATAMSKAVQIEFGWFFLFLGAILLIVCAAIKNK